MMSSFGRWVLFACILFASFGPLKAQYIGPIGAQQAPWQAEQGEFLISDVATHNLSSTIKYSSTQDNYVGRIEIPSRKEIDGATWIYVKNAIKYFQDKNPIFVMIELNSPGGEFYSAIKICEELNKLQQEHNIPVVCFINDWALSSAALIPFACRFNVCTSGSFMGSSAPMKNGKDPLLEDAKPTVVTDITQEFEAMAKTYGRSPAIASAMVNAKEILVNRGGQLMELDNPSEVIVNGFNPDVVLVNEGQLLTLNAPQMFQYNVADMVLTPLLLKPLTSEQISAGIWGKDQSILFQAPFFRDIPSATIHSYRPSFFEQFIGNLCMSWVLILMLVLVLVGFYIALAKPNLRYVCLISCLALLGVLSTSLFLEQISFLELVILALGLVVLYVAIFVRREFGKIGTIGLVLILIATGALLLPQFEGAQFGMTSEAITARGQFIIAKMMRVGIAIVISSFLIFIFNLFFFKPVATQAEEEVKPSIPLAEAEVLPSVGSHGVVKSQLCPAGKIEIAGVMHDAISCGDYLDEGTKIIVVAIRAGKILVDKQESV